MVLERTIIMTIKELCVKITLSREKLAEAAGVSASAITAVKTGCINLGRKISGAVKEVRGEAAAVGARAEERIQDTKAAAEEAKEKATIAAIETKAIADEIADETAEKAEEKIRQAGEKVKAAKVKAENTVPEAAEKAEEIKAAAEETKAKLKADAAAAEKTVKTRKKSQKTTQKAKAAKKEATVRETAARKPADEPIQVIIQSPIGGEITPEAILAKVGEADTVYVRVDENKAYWVKGEEHGSVDLW